MATKLKEELAAKELVEQEAESKKKEVKELQDKIAAAEADAKKQAEEAEELKQEKAKIEEDY